ncbi:hypothetical protein [Arthrobacter russicus]|uniref:Uncharacterized protein n=1 Tax=Arthrobacter russicus TaxID=172040 RepID=A0ABU1JE46_9MICC|nr:hypothetical protein [Arthrobacter russicus]MDR6270628.1 hypothetical protein [Arthrobacter russicus]
MSKYAQNTSVDSATLRAEIERTLARYGASSFMYGWEAERAAIGFTAAGKQVRFVLPMPDREAREFTHTPAKGLRRDATGIAVEYERAVRQRWRALALVVKAKLEAVEAGIVTFEEEFFAHLVLPGGKTVFQEAAPAVEMAIEQGVLRPLLSLPRSADFERQVDPDAEISGRSEPVR